MKRLLCFCLLLISLDQIFATNDDWQIEPTCNIPPERGGHKLVNIDDDVIVLWGGFWECFEPVAMKCDHLYWDDLWHYDLRRKNWLPINVTGPKPAPRTFFGFNQWDRKHGQDSLAVLFAGSNYNAPFTSIVNYGDIWFYNPKTETWTEVNATNAGPGTRIGPSVAIYKDDMYVFGGVNGTTTSSLHVKGDLWKFDLVTKTWTLLIQDGIPGNPEGAYLGSFRVDEKRKQIVLFSGAVKIPGAGILTNATWIYSIESNTWTQVLSTIPSRVHTSAEVIDDKFVVAFGDGQVVVNGTDQCITSTISSGHKPINEVWTLNLRTLVWSKLDVGCSERKKRTSSTRVGKRMFEWGGFNYKCPQGPPGYPIWDRFLRSLKIN